jgi:hypothetical protein
VKIFKMSISVRVKLSRAKEQRNDHAQGDGIVGSHDQSFFSTSPGAPSDTSCLKPGSTDHAK